MVHIHRAERADGLVRALGALLAEPPEDAFAPEIVAVPTRGMERWLTQQLSGVLGASANRSDGVCANVEFPSPRRLVDDAVAVAAGIHPDADAWPPERMVWPLLEVVDTSLEEPWLRRLAAHLGAGRARRFATVRHIAELFDRYALQRPTMIRAWANDQTVDATGQPLAADVTWQAELWQRLRERVDQPDPAERIEAACTRLRAEPALVDLPDRVSLFGLTRLPAGQLQVLRALAAHRDVHLFLLHPSPALWDRVHAATATSVRRADDTAHDLPRNRLLASWGQDVRELQLVIAAESDVDHHHATAQPADTLLATVQADVRADRQPPGPPLPDDTDQRRELAPDDQSVQIHACHGRARQVEVLRDAILHLLADDPALEPRDVIVMCPDIETFAPLIQATFGAGEVSADGDDADDDRQALPPHLRPPDLRVRLADRSLRQTNAVLGVVGRVLELAEERLTASQVLDLADREPVRRRFHLDDDDLARIEEWVAASGVRWGLDAAHRAPFKLDKLHAGTWRSGLDRVLLGVTMTEADQRLFNGVLPLDDVESGAIDVAGRLAELIDRLQAAVDATRTPMTVGEWATTIATAADALTATPPREAWQRAELRRVLDDVVTDAAVTPTAMTTTLSLPEIRALLADRLAGRPTRTNFRTGHLTICTLMPMRSVPHRVVCLLGLDDGEFPRKAVRDGDDLVLRDPHVGDRDSRTEDRQMLLDALMAATDRLVVTYTGKDERTNLPRPPAVPVGELLDVIDATARTADGEHARDRVLVDHPLQPFDPRNFTAGALVRERAWGFDQGMLEGARAIGAERDEPSPFLPAPLPDLPAPLVELDDLVRFGEHPVRAFLRQRLGISLGDFSDEVADGLTVELDNLEQWGVGRRLLEGRLAGADMDACTAAEVARGLLPPGSLGTPVIERLQPTVDEIARQALALTDHEPHSADVKVVLPDGRTLSGTVAGVHGDLLRAVSYSRVSPRHRLATWIRWLALTAAYPHRPIEAALIGRARAGSDAQVTIACFRPCADDDARAHLAVLLDLHRRGLREPLPLGCLSSAAYVHGADPETAARKAWESTWNYPKEDAEPEHQLAFGAILTFDELRQRPPRADERGDGWDHAETSRFGRLARRLWSGMLACEELVDR